MNLRTVYSEYMRERNVQGSGQASSYIRALDLLVPILAKPKSKFAHFPNLWEIQSSTQISALYEYVLEQQRLGEDGLFKGEKPISYWRDRYCSAALKSYVQFLVSYQHEQKLWNIYRMPKIKPDELGTQLMNKNIKDVELLVDEKGFDLKTKSGRDVVREVKARIGQQFFRKMILSQYKTQCCVTGLNIPEVLRASHIKAWSEDEQNRMNPANGLCLSATYDAAFDKHLISFDEEYRMIFSPDLKEYYSNQAFQTQFESFKGKKIHLPSKHLPDQKFLQAHREKLLA